MWEALFMGVDGGSRSGDEAAGVFGGASSGFMTVGDAAQLLGLSKAALFKRAERGGLVLRKVRVPGTQVVLSLVEKVAVLQVWRELRGAEERSGGVGASDV